jgi:hypothetical protein
MRIAGLKEVVMPWKPWHFRLAAVAANGLFWCMGVLGRFPGFRYPRFLSLDTWARTALERGDAACAARQAKELLALAESFREDWNYGNAVHRGHLVLGRIALASNDLASARAELLAAGRTPGSPQLNSFGPNMRLARDLLAVGERDSVLEYIDLCGAFWKMGEQDLPRWRQRSRRGGSLISARTFPTDESARVRGPHRAAPYFDCSGACERVLHPRPAVHTP